MNLIYSMGLTICISIIVICIMLGILYIIRR